MYIPHILHIIVLKMKSVQLLRQILLLAFFSCMQSESYMSERTCGILFSLKNFSGDAFILTDFDQTVNTLKDYRTSLYGLANVSSIKVENNCKISVCDQTYFKGTCTLLDPGNHLDSQIGSQIRSANCTCEKECKCGDIVLSRHEYGLLYTGAGCNTCKTEYTPLKHHQTHFSYDGTIQSIIIRKGCVLSVYPKYDFEGAKQEFETRIIQGFQGTIQSYKFSCKAVTLTPAERRNGPPLIQIPRTAEEFLLLVSSNQSVTNLPGVQAALNSLQNGRSWRNSYILLIGSDNPVHLGIHDCPLIKPKIRECCVSVDLNDMGISDVEIRIIYSIYDFEDEDDSRFIASLNDYLSNHEELKDIIPNAVVIHHSIDDSRFAKKGSLFHRKLEVLNSLRHQVHDDSYSNVVIVLDYLDFLFSDAQKRQPENKIAEFEKVVHDKLKFIKPIVIVVSQDDYKVKVNGYWKMKNEEYWPLNLQRGLRNIGEMSGDKLGQAIFKAAFSDVGVKPVVRGIGSNFLDEDDWKVIQFRGIKIIRLTNQKQLRVVAVAQLAKYYNLTSDNSANQVKPESVSVYENLWRQSQCSSYQWIPVSNISRATKHKMHHFGLADQKGRNIYPCRVVIKGIVRVGSFNFEDGSCRIFYVNVKYFKDTAEILIFPGCFSHVATDDNGNSYRFQYNLLSSWLFEEGNLNGNVIPVFAGLSPRKNESNYIAMASFSSFSKCDPVDVIGTAKINGTNYTALFEGNGNGRRVLVTNFNFVVCTITKLIA